MGIPARDCHKRKEGHRFEKAVIQLIDWNKKKVKCEIEYTSPKEHLKDGLSMQFKGGFLVQDTLFVVTNTEVLQWDINTWKILKVYSDPTFNDLHAVFYKDNKIYVCNTGLEIVQVINESGNIVEEINLAFTETWDRFERDKDYRQIATTKPHEVHINHIFEMGGEIWVTRGQKGDAVNLYNRSKKISVRDNSKEVILIHDGVLKKDTLFFSAVNGQIIKVHLNKSVEIIDLNKMVKHGNRLPWTRGLTIYNDRILLGATKMRKTKFKDLAAWALKGSPIKMPSSIIEFNLQTQKIEDIFYLNHPTAAIYSIIKV